MIEEIVIGYLSDYQHIPVYAERPEEPEAEYILIERTGMTKVNHIRKATIAVQSCSTVSLDRAAEINDAVERLMEGITDLTDISRCSLNSSYNFTDTETRTYRYQAVFTLSYMEGE